MDQNTAFWYGVLFAASVYGISYFITKKITERRELKKRYNEKFGYPPLKYLSKSDLKEALKIYEISHR